ELAQTADIGTVLQDKSYGRSFGLFHENNTGQYGGAAALGERFPFDPGSPPDAGGTFHAKTLAAVTPDNLTPTRKTNLRNKNYMVYITTAGVNHTLDGKGFGGEYVDVIRFND